MSGECLPLAELPGTSRLFHDYISGAAGTAPFYASTPPAMALRGREDYPVERRQAVAAVLKKQNQRWGAGAETLKNIERLRRGANAVVTGQQVALFGGPAYSIYKAMSAARAAEELTRRGLDCVPIFWLATQDHDFAEVAGALLRSSAGELRRFSSPPSAPEGTPVGAIVFDEEIVALASAAAEFLGGGEAGSLLRECYVSGETLGSALGRLFLRLLASQGLIVIDPRDQELATIAAPLYEQAAQCSAQLSQALEVRGRQLEAAGYHQQVKVTADSTLLFVELNGIRRPLKRHDGEFVACEKHLSQGDVARLLREEPQSISGNALLRPVAQDFLLPTVAYFGGPAEIAYFAQAAVVYEALLGRITPILPRLSATLLDARDRRLLERYQLNAKQLIASRNRVAELIAAHSMPQELEGRFDQLESETSAALEQLRASLERLDPTLAEAAANASTKITHQIASLKGKAESARLRRDDDMRRQAQALSDSLLPNGELQEREIAGISYVARFGDQLFRKLTEAAEPGCLGHHVIEM